MTEVVTESQLVPSPVPLPLPPSGTGEGTALTQLGALTARFVRAMLRQPAYLAVSLVQALVWLPLFGSLFSAVADVPGFGGGAYIDFLTPGVVVMSALFSAGWTGLYFIQDMDRGVMDRLLASPLRRWALVGGTLTYQGILNAVQTMIVVGIGWALGTHYRSGLPGVLVMLAVAVLLTTAVAGLSDALALTVRKEETLIAATNFLVLPLTFMSSAMMTKDLLPDWIRTIAYVNPVDWAVTACREAISADPDWAAVGQRLLLLAVLALVAGWLATRAFRAYQRSL
jgi:ABC-2 type transport system permease protein